MNAILYPFFILTFIINIFYINSFRLTTNKIHNNNLLSKLFRSLLSENNSAVNTYVNIPVFSSKEGLYTITLNIGNPSQQFSLLLDTGSPYLWINDENCIGCKSQHKFISSLSDTFHQSSDIIKINYLSGEISGNICTDLIKFNSTNSKIQDFNFILVNETNINYEFEGIFGLSKGAIDIQNLLYSTIYQLRENNFLKQNTFLFDFPRNNFYIGEIPSNIKQDDSFSFKNLKDNKFDGYYWHCLFEKIKFNKNKQLISTNTTKYNYIFFDSGINGLIFPLNYTYIFENVISNNKLLKNSECYIQAENEKKKIYSLNCKNNINNLINGENKEYKKIYNDEEFITFDLSKDKFIILKLNDIFNKEDNSFKIYFTNTPNNAIFLGIPFFEKYTILFDKDNNEVTIYDVNKKEKDNKNKYIIICSVIFSIIILILIAFLIYKIIVKRRDQVNNENIEKNIPNSDIIESETNKMKI